MVNLHRSICRFCQSRGTARGTNPDTIGNIIIELVIGQILAVGTGHLAGLRACGAEVVCCGGVAAGWALGVVALAGFTVDEEGHFWETDYEEA